jgi:hypothetical protein
MGADAAAAMAGATAGALLFCDTAGFPWNHCEGLHARLAALTVATTPAVTSATVIDFIFMIVSFQLVEPEFGMRPE